MANERAARAYSATSRHESEVGSLRPALLTLMSAVALVLLVAAANTTGLLLLRAAGRRREIAVRTALGASPRRIARALVIEGLVLAAASGVLGLLAAPLLVRGLLSVAPAFYALDRDAALLSGGLDNVCCVRRAVGGGRRVCVVLLRGRQSDQRDWRAPGLGAAPRQIMWSVVSRALLLGAAATAVGLAVAAAAARLLRSVLFGVSAADPFTYLAVGIALVATVLLAALFPALRAARVDPLAAIRR